MVAATQPATDPRASFWTTAVIELYGLEVTLEPLDGEYDLNFRVLRDGAPFFVLKVMRPGCEEALVDLQCQAIQRLAKRLPDAPLPSVVATKAGGLFAHRDDERGEDRLVWMITHLTGECYATHRPKTIGLAGEIGTLLGRIDRELNGWSHPALDRDMKWDLAAAHWVDRHVHLIADAERRRIVEAIMRDYRTGVQPALAHLDRQPVHNDANDYNLLADCAVDGEERLSGLIDFGDMILSPRICEIAIAGAYVVLDQADPLRMLAALVGGYHEVNPLSADEIRLIYPLVQTRLAVSVVNSAIMKSERPDDPYVMISEAPAWRFLDAAPSSSGREAESRLRLACGMPLSRSSDRLLAWLGDSRGSFAPVLGRDLKDLPVVSLSVADSTVPRNPLSLEPDEAEALGGGSDNDEWTLGGYAEPRLIYTSDGFRDAGYPAGDRRTVHLGIDVFAPAGTTVHAPLEGVVEAVSDAPERFDYGGMVVLVHETPDGDRFRTLYGHLDPSSIAALNEGTTVSAGTPFAQLGSAVDNGGWAPHLHLQLCIDECDAGSAWPGAADPDDQAFWLAVFPNPSALLNLDDDKVRYRPLPESRIAEERERHFAANLKLSYKKPCLFLRGWRHYLFDEMGRPYLDAYNNVPHVGHAHPRIQAVAAEQLKRLNSNTRYLHPAQTAFADKILSKMPKRFQVCFFVNSGSEGNELALRLARAHTGGKDMVTPDHGYHGMTTGAIDISAYKFNRPGGVGRPDWVQLVSIPDTYRGRFRESDPDSAQRYVEEIDAAIAAVNARGGKLAGFIAETFPSVGGQIIPPEGYLAGVYERIRAAGGIGIADEVQTGLGRLGADYWAFELQGVEPDIVVLGKPLGNGHPLGAVITTREIAESFANGIEFFSTFGGSVLSCRIGREVLQIVDDENLQANARIVGARLTDGFRSLMSRHNAIGDVRGHGLFIGVELVRDPEKRDPATGLADYVVNRLRNSRILVGVEGPDENILKVRPPLTIGPDDADMILDRFDRILSDARNFRTWG